MDDPTGPSAAFGAGDDEGADVGTESEKARPRVVLVVIAVVVLAALGALALVLGGDDDDEEEAPEPTVTTVTTTTQLSARLTIAELLPLDTQYETYLELVEGTDLLELLGEDEPVTAFIPESSAWEEPPEDEAGALAQLRRLTVPGVVTGTDLLGMDGDSIENIDGDELAVELGEDGTLTVGGATVLKRDIVASNGMIHVVSDLEAS